MDCRVPRLKGHSIKTELSIHSWTEAILPALMREVGFAGARSPATT
jgi:hypothetical protein